MSMCAFVGVCYIECILNINWKLKLIEKMNQINFNGCWSKIHFNCYSHEIYIVWISYPHFVLLFLEGSWKISMPWMKWFGNQNRILFWNFKLFFHKIFSELNFHGLSFYFLKYEHFPIKHQQYWSVIKKTRLYNCCVSPSCLRTVPLITLPVNNFIKHCLMFDQGDKSHTRANIFLYIQSLLTEGFQQVSKLVPKQKEQTWRYFKSFLPISRWSLEFMTNMYHWFKGIQLITKE